MKTSTDFGKHHTILREHGYERVASRTHVYRKFLDVNGIIFPIRLHLHDSSFETWPTVFIEKIPSEVNQRIAHLLQDDKTLCYLDTEAIEIDKYFPEKNMSLVVQQIDQILGDCVNDPEFSNDEIRRELSYYWQGEGYRSCFIIEKGKKLEFLIFDRQSNVSKDNTEEIVISCSQEHNSEWARKRASTKNILTGQAFTIELPSSICIPKENWPPETFREVIGWLENHNSHSQADQFIEFSFIAISERKPFLIILRSNTIYLGCLFFLQDYKAVEVLVNASRRSKRNKKTGIKRQQKLALITNSLRNKTEIIRMLIQDATEEHVIGRNLTDNSLENTKIALLGCGTVGGYVAHLLAQVGAGSGNGKLALYDNGILESGNLGRHILGMQYLGENKADALAHWIQESSSSRLNIRAFGNRLKMVDVEHLCSEYEIIVDATGLFQFSHSLSDKLHSLRTRTPLIHVWVDAGGCIARCLLDDMLGKHACYYCLNGSPYSHEREKLFHDGKEIPEWKPDACGIGSYIPFSSQASVSAAGLLQGIVVDYVNGRPSPRFRQITIDSSIALHRKDKDVKAKSDCRCCKRIN